jgi:signal peptidase I
LNSRSEKSALRNDPKVAKKVLADAEKPRETTVEFLAGMAELFVIVLFVLTFVMQNFEIPSGSMENTLLIGDHLFVNREQFAPRTRWMGPLMPYREIRRGDVAVFFSPEQPGLFLVKRIVGVPGDRIHVHDGDLYRNGQKLNEPYVQHRNGDFNPYRDNFPAVPPSESYGVTSQDWRLTMLSYVQGEDVVVPPNSYFGMGDNRDNSKDSRYWGFIPRENLIGRPMFIYWSFITPSDQYLMRGPGDRLAFLLHTVIHFFDGTRWSRTLKVVQ